MTAVIQDKAGSGSLDYSPAGCFGNFDCSDILDYSGSYHCSGILALGIDSGRTELHLISEDQRNDHGPSYRSAAAAAGAHPDSTPQTLS